MCMEIPIISGFIIFPLYFYGAILAGLSKQRTDPLGVGGLMAVRSLSMLYARSKIVPI